MNAPALASGVVRLTGRDVATVLQNVATQRFDDLPADEPRLTLFCDFRGRLLHRTVALRMADDSVWLVREDAPGDSLAAYLDRNVFREDVKIEDLSTAWRVRSFPERIGAETRIERSGETIRMRIAGAPDYELTTGVPDAAADPGWEETRIRAGWARHGFEITNDFHPFEVNLGHAVHLDKGCFTGHEILMRLVTYRGVRRRLGRVEGAGATTAPCDLLREGKAIGRLTSAIAMGGGWSGLAVLRHETSEPGTALEIEGGGAARIAEVFELRLPIARPLNL